MSGQDGLERSSTPLALDEHIVSTQHVSAAELMSLLEHAHQSSLLLIDARPLAAYSAGHITSSLNVNLPSLLNRRYRRKGGSLGEGARMISDMGLEGFVTTREGRKVLESWRNRIAPDALTSTMATLSLERMPHTIVVYDDTMDEADLSTPAWTLMGVLAVEFSEADPQDETWFPRGANSVRIRWLKGGFDAFQQADTERTFVKHGLEDEYEDMVDDAIGDDNVSLTASEEYAAGGHSRNSSFHEDDGIMKLSGEGKANRLPRLNNDIKLDLKPPRHTAPSTSLATPDMASTTSRSSSTPVPVPPQPLTITTSKSATSAASGLHRRSSLFSLDTSAARMRDNSGDGRITRAASQRVPGVALQKDAGRDSVAIDAYKRHKDLGRSNTLHAPTFAHRWNDKASSSSMSSVGSPSTQRGSLLSGSTGSTETTPSTATTTDGSSTVLRSSLNASTPTITASPIQVNADASLDSVVEHLRHDDTDHLSPKPSTSTSTPQKPKAARSQVAWGILDASEDTSERRLPDFSGLSEHDRELAITEYLNSGLDQDEFDELSNEAITTPDSSTTFSISEVIPQFLCIGPELVHKEDVDMLLERGVVRVLNMAEECEDRILEEGGYLTGSDPKLTYRKIEARDTVEFKDVEACIAEALEFIADSKSHHEPIYVHCKAGKSRSVTAVLAYLIAIERWTLKRAYRHLTRVRPSICPNIGFVAELMRIEDGVHGQVSSFAGSEWMTDSLNSPQLGREVDRLKREWRGT